MTNYFFVFFGRTRPWNPINGLRNVFVRSGHADKDVVVVRSLPGGIVGWGSTWSDATKMLRDRIDNAIARSGSISDWYGKAVSKMTNEERNDFGEAMHKAAMLFLEGESALMPPEGSGPRPQILEHHRNYSSFNVSLNDLPHDRCEAETAGAGR